MLFWGIIIGLAAIVTGILVRGATSGAGDQAPPAAFDVQVYRDQLAEVDKDLARGVIREEDADRVTAEISRRILAADAAAADIPTGRASARGANPVAIVALALVLIAGSVGIYWQLGAPGYGDLSLETRIATAEDLRLSRPDQATAEASVPIGSVPPAPEATEDYLNLVRQLRGVVAERPDDVEGHRLLAISESNLGNYDAAHRVFARYIELRGDAVRPEEMTDLADMMVLAAGGYISPEAEAVLQRALTLDPSNGPARYYWALMMAQTGRPDQAFRIWDRLLREGPSDAPWIPPIQSQIEDMAIRAGVNYVMPDPGTGRGPSAEDIAAAGEMSPQERMEMIAGMVQSLSERLSTEGGTVDEWAQLITALGVLGRFDDARRIYANGQQMFAEDRSALDHLYRAAERAGVAQ